MKKAIITSVLTVLVAVAYSQTRTLTDFLKTEHSRFEIVRSEDTISPVIRYRENPDLYSFSEYAQVKARPSRVQSADVAQKETFIYLWKYSFQDVNAYHIGIDSLLSCFGPGCQKITPGGVIEANSVPSVYIMDGRSIYIIQTNCETANDKWTEFKADFIRYFSDLDASLIVTDCDGGQWQGSAYYRPETITPVATTKSQDTQTEIEEAEEESVAVETPEVTETPVVAAETPTPRTVTKPVETKQKTADQETNKSAPVSSTAPPPPPTPVATTATPDNANKGAILNTSSSTSTPKQKTMARTLKLERNNVEGIIVDPSAIVPERKSQKMADKKPTIDTANIETQVAVSMQPEPKPSKSMAQNMNLKRNNVEGIVYVPVAAAAARNEAASDKMKESDSLIAETKKLIAKQQTRYSSNERQTYAQWRASHPTARQVIPVQEPASISEAIAMQQNPNAPILKDAPIEGSEVVASEIPSSSQTTATTGTQSKVTKTDNSAPTITVATTDTPSENKEATTKTNSSSQANNSIAANKTQTTSNPTYSEDNPAFQKTVIVPAKSPEAKENQTPIASEAGNSKTEVPSPEEPAFQKTVIQPASGSQTSSPTTSTRRTRTVTTTTTQSRPSRTTSSTKPTESTGTQIATTSTQTQAAEKNPPTYNKPVYQKTVTKQNRRGEPIVTTTTTEPVNNTTTNRTTRNKQNQKSIAHERNTVETDGPTYNAPVFKKTVVTPTEDGNSTVTSQSKSTTIESNVETNNSSKRIPLYQRNVMHPKKRYRGNSYREKQSRTIKDEVAKTATAPSSEPKATYTPPAAKVTPAEEPTRNPVPTTTVNSDKWKQPDTAYLEQKPRDYRNTDWKKETEDPNANRTTTPPVVRPKPKPPVQKNGPSISGDFNGDGRVDEAYIANLYDDGTSNYFEVRFSSQSIEPLDAGCCNVKIINEGDLNGNGTDEISVYKSQANGCNATMETYSLQNGYWELYVPTFIIDNGCRPLTESQMKARIYTQAGSIYYLDVLPNNPGRLTPVKVYIQ